MSFYEGKKVLVTGGTGFCGRHVVEALLEQGAEVLTPIHKNCDLTQELNCLGMTQGMDYVFHFAGAVGNAGADPAFIMSAIATNLTLTSRILHACWKVGVKRLLLCGSSTVYPDLDHPVTEDEALSGPLHPSYFGYGSMYRYIEQLADFVTMRSDLKIARVRPTAVYGRGDTSDHVIPSLIRKAVDKADPFVVWGNGKQTRDFLHVTDLARGCLFMLEHYAVNDPVNIGYGTSVCIADVVKTLLHAAGHKPAAMYFDVNLPTAIPYRAVDCSKAKTLGFEAQMSLEKGLNDTVEWYKETQCVSV